MAFSLKKLVSGADFWDKKENQQQRQQFAAEESRPVATTPAPGAPRNVFQKAFEQLTPTNETNIRNANASIANANNQLKSAKYGVLSQGNNAQTFAKLNAPTNAGVVEQLSQAGEAVGDTLINDILQPSARSVAGLTQSFRPNANEATYTPGSRVEQGLFGAAPVSSYQKESVDQYRRDLENGTSKPLAMLKAAGLGVLNTAEGLANVAPAGGIVTKGARTAAKPVVQAARDAKLIAPSNLADNELAALNQYRSTMGTGAIDDEIYQAGRQAAEKAGLKHTDIEGIDNLLGAQRSFDNRPRLFANETGAIGRDVRPSNLRNFTDTTNDLDIDKKISEVVNMSPQQYLDEAFKVTDGSLGGSYDSWLASNAQAPKIAQEYADALTRGDKFPLPYIDRATGSQDGRNRAIAAQLAGIDEIPVGIIPELSNAQKIANFEADLVKYGEQSYLGNRAKRMLSTLLKDEQGSIGRNIRETPEAAVPKPTTKLVRSQPDSLPDTVPTTGLVRNRGLADTLMNNERTPMESRAELINRDTSYNVRDTNDLQIKAANLVKTDEDAALRMATQGTDDNAVATGLELVKKYQNEGNFEKAIDLVEVIAPKLTEAGRTSQAAAIYGRLSPEGVLRFTQRQIDRYNEAEGLVKNGKQTGKKTPYRLPEDQAQKIVEKAKRIQKLPDGDEKTQLIGELSRDINAVAPTPVLEKIANIWRAGLLTSFRTLEGGIIGNTTKAALDIPSNAIAAGIDKLITAPLRRGANKGVRSNVFTLKGTVSGLGEGAGKAGNYLKTGIDPRDVGRGYDTKQSNYNQGNKVINTLGKGSDYVYRAMGAIDNPFYYSGLRRATREEALLEASKQGLKGKEARKFADDYVANPERVESAVDKAREGVFQNDTSLGTIATAFKNAPQKIKNPENRAAAQLVVDFIVPFVKIPSAVATSLANYSPAGVVAEVIKQVVRRQADLQKLNKAIGQSTVGTTGGVVVGQQLYNKGLLTLEAPTDKDERQLWELEGRQPFSVKVGGKWRKLNYVQPLGSLMAVGGGYERAKVQGAESPIIAAGAAGLKSVSDQSFLKGVSGFASAIQDPQRSAQTFANNTTGSLVPNIVRDVARATDDKEREANTMVDALRNGIPGLRQQNLPQRDAFGKEIDRKQSPGAVLFDPFKSTTPKNDEVTSEIRRLYDLDPQSPDMKVAPSKIEKQLSIGGKDAVLTPEQLDQFESIVGAPTYDKIKAALASDEYKGFSDADKAKNIQKIITGTRMNAKENFAKNNVLKDKRKNILDFSNTEFETRNTDLRATGDDSNSKDKNPSQAYNDALTNYQKNKKSYTRAEDLKKSKELNRLRAGADYDKDIIDLYSLSKEDAQKLLAFDPDGANTAKKLAAYGDALVAAGAEKYNKFRTATKKSGGRKTAKGSKAKKYTYKVGSFQAANKSNATTLRALLRTAR